VPVTAALRHLISPCIAHLTGVGYCWVRLAASSALRWVKPDQLAGQLLGGAVAQLRRDRPVNAAPAVSQVSTGRA